MYEVVIDDADLIEIMTRVVVESTAAVLIETKKHGVEYFLPLVRQGRS